MTEGIFFMDGKKVHLSHYNDHYFRVADEMNVSYGAYTARWFEGLPCDDLLPLTIRDIREAHRHCEHAVLEALGGAR